MGFRDSNSGPKSTEHALLVSLAYLVLCEAGSPSSLGFTDMLRWLAIELLGSTCLYLGAGITGAARSTLKSFYLDLDFSVASGK